MKYFKFITLPLGVILALVWINAFAIDNPDTPDLIKIFRADAAMREQKINDDSQATSLSYSKAYFDYQVFLETKLNNTIKTLNAKLDASTGDRFSASQLQWVKFKNAEFKFIDKNWNPKHFGSSYVLSRGAYKCNIIKSRIISVLSYLMNYK